MDARARARKKCVGLTGNVSDDRGAQESLSGENGGRDEVEAAVMVGQDCAGIGDEVPQQGRLFRSRIEFLEASSSSSSVVVEAG